MKKIDSVDKIKASMKKENYICDDPLAFTLYLAMHMEKPLLLEGEPGVGKTEVAKVLAQVLGRKLIRLQCYECLDATSAIYEWNYAKKILKIKALDSAGAAGQCSLLAKAERWSGALPLRGSFPLFLPSRGL
jgi:MoxR-like ATPase